MQASTYFSLTHSSINVQEHLERVRSEDCGAISSFIGTVRNSFQGQKVIRLEYTAYEKMARAEMQKIFEEVLRKWENIKFVSVEHRLGSVLAGEASVVIACSAPDRQSSLQACSYIIEEFKARVTIWKKEIGEDWQEWKANKESKINH